MHDPKDRAAAFPLGEFLKACDPCAEAPGAKPCLRQDFQDADIKAIQGQTAYGRVARVAAVLGLGALLVGLVQPIAAPYLVSFPALQSLLFFAEFLYTAVALVWVLVAILKRRQEHWLSERFKAERLRLLKFKLLIDPKLWHADLRELAPWRDRLETGRRTIANQSEEILDALKLSDAMPDLPATDDCLAVEVPALQRLLEYYRRKRLGSQLAYFEGKIRKPLSLADNPGLPPIVFFAGIAIALCNVVLVWATKGTKIERVETMSLVLVFLSFAIPLGWSAVRTLKGAHEVGRNAARSHARHASLTEIAQSLNAATTVPPERWDRPVIFGYLYLCEGILATDQHEWLRLMRYAEWYG